MPTVHSRPAIFSSISTWESKRIASPALRSSRNALDELQADAGALADRFEQQPAGPSPSASLPRRIQEHESRGRNARRHAALLGEVLVERDAAGFGVATGVGHAQFLQPALHGAVFAVGPVQGEEHDFGAPRQNPISWLGIHFTDSWPSERRALATPAPERSETSRSALGPPSMTVMFNLSMLPFIPRQ